MDIAKKIDFINNKKNIKAAVPEFLSYEDTKPVRHLHYSVPGYEPTPLVSLSALAEKIGVKGIYVKDESYRFGLKAFKALGGIYALTCLICERFNLDINKVNFTDLKEMDIYAEISKLVFITATDGNHGKGIAWAAEQLGCKAYIYMPKGSSEIRAQAIREIGDAEVTIIDKDYDDTVRYALEISEKNNWILVQDTSWEGYERIPTWIVQGYTTMVYEAIKQLEEYTEGLPTHLFVQAGVGAMAGSVIGYMVNYYKENAPVITVVEPDQVACIFESMKHNDGQPHKAVGNGKTIMAGLNCGEPCTVTWPIIRDFADYYVSCPDEVAEKGMKILSAPLGYDKKIVSGESGAVTSGLLVLLMEEEALKLQRKEMGLDENSVILLFNTEGDTDPEAYEAIVNGKRGGNI